MQTGKCISKGLLNWCACIVYIYLCIHLIGVTEIFTGKGLLNGYMHGWTWVKGHLHVCVHCTVQGLCMGTHVRAQGYTCRLYCCLLRGYDHCTPNVAEVCKGRGLLHEYA